MSALPADHFAWTDPWRTLEHLDADPALEGWRSELVGGAISLTPPPTPEHERIVTDLTKQLTRQNPDDALTYWAGGTGLRLGLGSGVKPDVIISDADAFAGMHTECSPVAGEPIHLVVEVTSPSTRERDYREKMRAYAAAGLPHYLVIDREDRACRLYRFADGAGSYGPPAAVAAFGQSLPLPEPIGFALGTSRFE